MGRKKDKTALEKAVALIAQRDYSEKRLREKLRFGGFGEEETDGAIERLKAEKYLDDERTCKEAFARMYEEGRESLREIRRKLSARGFSEDLIERSAPTDGDAGGREEQAALSVLRKKFKKAAPREKIKAFLYRRGFSYDTCVKATDAFFEERPELMTEETDFYDE